MKTSETLKEIASSLSKLQSQLVSVNKDTKAYNYKYSTLANVWDSLRDQLVECGLAVIQDTFSDEKGVHVTTRVLHNSGEWIEFGPLCVPMAKRDAHSTGSAITYGRRYSLTAALGVVSSGDDDDGAAAQKSTQKQTPKEKPKEKPKCEKITNSQYEKLEFYLEDNIKLRENILLHLKENYSVNSLQDTPTEPVNLYESFISTAKHCYNDRIAENKEAQ